MDTFSLLSFIIGALGFGFGIAGMVLGIRANKRLDELK